MSIEQYSEMVCDLIYKKEPCAEVSSEFIDTAFEDGLTAKEAAESYFK